jgi:hypothetical protein
VRPPQRTRRAVAPAGVSLGRAGLVNVVVRDKSGAVVRGLTRADFSITEDDKPQR